MKPTVYVETTIISYLAARPSRDRVSSSLQLLTRAWWSENRARYRLCIAEPVATEAARGDPVAATARARLIAEFEHLPTIPETDSLARRLVQALRLPRRAELDAVHVAVATVHGVDYLLTWNCKHLAHPARVQTIESVCRAAGYRPPLICTPHQLM
jgi:predicted nucleic acid-binding protein